MSVVERIRFIRNYQSIKSHGNKLVRLNTFGNYLYTIGSSQKRKIIE